MSSFGVCAMAASRRHYLGERLEPVDCERKRIGQYRCVCHPTWSLSSSSVLVSAVVLRCCAALLRLASLSGRRWRNLLQNAIELGIHVIEPHLDIRHALGERYDIRARRHAHLLQHFEHRLLHRFAKGRGCGEVGIENCATGLGIGLAVHGLDHGFRPDIQIGVTHSTPRIHGIERLAILCAFSSAIATPSPTTIYPATAPKTLQWILLRQGVGGFEAVLGTRYYGQLTLESGGNRLERLRRDFESCLLGLDQGFGSTLERIHDGRNRGAGRGRAASWWLRKRSCFARKQSPGPSSGLPPNAQPTSGICRSRCSAMSA